MYIYKCIITFILHQAEETSTAGSAFAQNNFNITITPVNDEAPSFGQVAYSVSIPESTSGGSSLPLTITVDDGDYVSSSLVSSVLLQISQDITHVH